MRVAGKLLYLAVGMTTFGAVASANCWNECGLPNPFGGCGKYVKVCDVENPGRAAASLGNDIKDAENRIISDWHDAYGDVPQPLRQVLDDYPIAIICALVPETQAYTLAVAAVETLVANSKARSQEAAPVLERAPDWKKPIILSGEKLLMQQDISYINFKDWNDPNAQPMRNRFGAVHAQFLSCIDSAQDLPSGKACYNQLVDAVLAMSRM